MDSPPPIHPRASPLGLVRRLERWNELRVTSRGVGSAGARGGEGAARQEGAPHPVTPSVLGRAAAARTGGWSTPRGDRRGAACTQPQNPGVSAGVLLVDATPMHHRRTPTLTCQGHSPPWGGPATHVAYTRRGGCVALAAGEAGARAEIASKLNAPLHDKPSSGANGRSRSQKAEGAPDGGAVPLESRMRRGRGGAIGARGGVGARRRAWRTRAVAPLKQGFGSKGHTDEGAGPRQEARRRRRRHAGRAARGAGARGGRRGQNARGHRGRARPGEAARGKRPSVA
jgi:hypothetical protein